jgi:molybdenum-dependent DNA-binding transcriptional regulator ModE
MSSARDVLTPDALFMLNAIAQNGSFAGAAREIGVVPSALSYRVRQMVRRWMCCSSPVHRAKPS